MIRLDSHQHFWRYRAEQYPWITAEKGVLKRDYLPENLEPLLKSNRFDGSIAVQARQTIEETDWLLSLAGEHSFIKGVVGWVDLRSPGLVSQLETHGRNLKLVGVRHVVHDEPDDNFMLRPEFRAGIARLAAFGLAYDLLLFPRHLPVATELASEFPAQTFVLGHIAKPPIGRGEHRPWERDLKALARCPNVACKLSGMVTETKWGQWRPDDFYIYLDVVLAAFGPARVMIGSDWPVCTLSGSYGETMGIVANYIAGLSQEHQDGIFGGNCCRIYGI